MDLKFIAGNQLVNVGGSGPSVSAFRPEDFLVLHFEFVNLRVSQAGQGQALNILDPGKPSFIIVHFPPQNIAEQAFFEASNGQGKTFPLPPSDPDANKTGSDNLLPPPVESRLGFSSRLVFKVPANAGQIPLTLQDLLGRCAQYDLNIASSAHGPEFVSIGRFRFGDLGTLSPPRPVPPEHNLILQHRAWLLAQTSPTLQREAALPGAPPSEPAPLVAAASGPRRPSGVETAIEMPYRLILSQNQYGAWKHASTPVRSSETKRTELWHTRSAIRKPGGSIHDSSSFDTLGRCSAIWTRDWDLIPASAPPAPPPAHQNMPPRASLDASDRHNIVMLSASKNNLDVSRLMLSSVGGWMDVQGQLDGTGLLTVQAWRQITAMGRDQYARVVYKGYLFPFGHAASLVKVTERKFHMSLPGNPAYLRQRMYIVVREPEKLFLSATVDPASHKRYDLQMPFRRVRITTMVTPDLDAPGPNQSQFYPMVAGHDFLFHLVAEGLDGKEIEFSAPLLFLDETADNPATLGPVAKAYDAQMKGTYDLRGQNVVFAEFTDPNAPDRVKPGSTRLETTSIIFGAEIPDAATLQTLFTSCHFYPAVRGAKVVVPAIRQLAGNDAPLDVAYHDGYLQHGFDGQQNTGQIFLEIRGGASDVNFAAAGHGDRTGALVTPSMKMTGLSRLLGPVAGSLDTLRAGAFDPNDFFNSVDALLFGTIPLKGILKRLDFSDLTKLPRFMSEAVTVIEELLQDITAIQVLAGRLSGLQAQAARPAAAAPAGASPVDLVTAVVNDVSQIIKDLEQLVQNPLSPNPTLVADLKKLAGDPNNPGDLQKLVDSLPAVGNLADAKRSLQQISTRLTQELADATFLDALRAEQITVKFEWKPEIQAWGFSGNSQDKALFWPANPNSCTVSVELHVKRRTGEPTADIYCGFRDFKLQLIAPTTFLILDFDVVEFTAASGKKPDVNVKLKKDGVQFAGALAFVNTLRKLIPIDGFSDPPALSVTADGIDASYSMALPSVGIGVFTLQNLSLAAGFNIPFIVKPLSVRFNFCTRDQPFLLTVAMFGGGGFFSLVIDPHGVQTLEAALEFGASVAMDFAVASGAVSVMAGIYFSMKATNVDLAGFLRIDGHVEVLGIVTVSIAIELDLKYDSANNSVVGEATIIIEVSVLFFSASVPLHCRKQFAGGEPAPPKQVMARMPGPPVPPTPARVNRVTFEDLMQPDGTNQPWHDYCRAFA
jgi:hypothetical protein